MYLYGETSNWKGATNCGKERRFQEEMILQEIVNCGNKLYVYSLGDSMLPVGDKFEKYECIKRMVHYLYCDM
jgi:hypothetical protein